MAISKVMYGEKVLLDLTKDTVTPEKMEKDVTGHDARGEPITGTHECKGDIGTGKYVWAIYDTKKVWDYTIKNVSGTAKPSGYSDTQYNQREITADGYWKLSTKIGTGASNDVYYLPEGAENGKTKVILRKSGYSYVNPYTINTIKDTQDTVQGDNLTGYISADASDAYPQKGLQEEKYYIRIAGSDANLQSNKMLSGTTGYRSSGKVTGNIQSLEAQTITPGTSDQTIATGKYLAGAQTIKGDQNLLAENIKNGVEIFGVTGEYAPAADAPKVARGTFTPSGTEDVVVDTGLESVSAFVAFIKSTLTSISGLQCLYYDESSTRGLGTHYSSYLSTSSVSRGTVSVDGGTVTYSGKEGTADSYFATGKIYDWIAIE